MKMVRRGWRMKSLIGFTLVELLIVILIIAILAAVLLPIFGKARESARRSNCQSNLRQLAQAFKQYSADYDDRLPLWEMPCWGGYRWTWVNPPWWFRIFPYVGEMGIFTCPSDRGWDYFQGHCYQWACWWRPDWRPDQPLAVISYGYNAWIANDIDQSSSLEAWKRPARTYLLADSWGALMMSWAQDRNGTLGQVAFAQGVWRCGARFAQWPINNCLWPSEPIPGDVDIYTRHAGGSNIAYMDGHVKWLPWNRIKAATVPHWRGRQLQWGGTIIVYPWGW